MITKETIESVRALARQNRREEICGLITTGLQIYPIKNVSCHPENCFVFDKRGYIEALSRIGAAGEKVLCVYHSHPVTPPDPSREDLESMRRSKYSLLIVSQTEHRWIDHAQ